MYFLCISLLLKKINTVLNWPWPSTRLDLMPYRGKTFFCYFYFGLVQTQEDLPPPPQYKGSGRWFVQLHAVRRASSLCLSTFLMSCVYGFVFLKSNVWLHAKYNLGFWYFKNNFFFASKVTLSWYVPKRRCAMHLLVCFILLKIEFITRFTRAITLWGIIHLIT